MYTINELETFIAIVENKGVVSAASALNISPATVSHRLSKLERILGTVLIYRDSRNVRPSAEGEEFYQRVGDILAALHDAEFAIGARDSAISGRLRVTLPPWIFSIFILPKLAQFEQQYPDIVLDFLVTDQFVNVVDDAQDVAIRVGTLASSGLLARKIVNNKRILCASPYYLKQHPPITDIESLSTHRFVALPWQKQLKLLQNDGNVFSFNSNTRFTISNSDNMTQALRAGHGIGIKSEIAIKQCIASGELVEVLPNVLASPEAPVWFLRPQNSLATRKAEAFYDFVKQAFSHC
ncbi:LysR family transcriptional regulator [Paraglaciecola agarilytica]|jgi:DNA-binding transcriptional LysR family regulator|uniref:LysR family transcriptional regulator n=1 Tax=Paraglaciecola chathamensis TaxID=368405 RepID=UPI001C07FB1A|nr:MULTISPECIES: LysR family transcriptional regulator [Paraglaciecola]MBU3017032.1 LysR family transcriptional regulator [Paraglaciecola agarilytica]MDO6560532.1 LysR family transcriptional regulator [Paraglaciecola chathamensis]